MRAPQSTRAFRKGRRPRRLPNRRHVRAPSAGGAGHGSTADALDGCRRHSASTPATATRLPARQPRMLGRAGTVAVRAPKGAVRNGGANSALGEARPCMARNGAAACGQRAAARAAAPGNARGPCGGLLQSGRLASLPPLPSGQPRRTCMPRCGSTPGLRKSSGRPSTSRSTSTGSGPVSAMGARRMAPARACRVAGPAAGVRAHAAS